MPKVVRESDVLAQLVEEAAKVKPEDAVSHEQLKQMALAAFAQRLKRIEDVETARKLRANPGGDGSGGPFDFSHQWSLLRMSLQTAVPLHIWKLNDLRRHSPECFWEHTQRISQAASEFLAEHSDCLMFKVSGKSAAAFNHLARGIACMSFYSGGVTAFDDHWETSVEEIS